MTGSGMKKFKERLPEAEVYLMTYYPVNETDKLPEEEWAKYMFVIRNNKNIQ